MPGLFDLKFGTGLVLFTTNAISSDISNEKVIKSAEISYESVIKINDISTFNWSLAPVLQIEDEK